MRSITFYVASVIPLKRMSSTYGRSGDLTNIHDIDRPLLDSSPMLFASATKHKTTSALSSLLREDHRGSTIPNGVHRARLKRRIACLAGSIAVCHVGHQVPPLQQRELSHRRRLPYAHALRAAKQHRSREPQRFGGGCKPNEVVCSIWGPNRPIGKKKHRAENNSLT